MINDKNNLLNFSSNENINNNINLKSQNEIDNSYYYIFENFYLNKNELLDNFDLLSNNYIKDICKKLNPEEKYFVDNEYLENIIKGIYSIGFFIPSLIQKFAIPIIFSGKDCIIQEKSGCGKTGAFIIGSLLRLNIKNKYTQILVINPTRELAKQTYNIFKEICKYVDISISLHVGGLSQYNFNNFINDMIVIGTPGRITALLDKKKISFDDLSIFIIDECDDMLRSSFQESVSKIVYSINSTAQFVLISATIDDNVVNLSLNLLRNPIKLLLNKKDVFVENIQQFYILVDKEQDKISTLFSIINNISYDQCIIYINKIDYASLLYNKLFENKFSVAVIHSNLSNDERINIFNNFKNGKYRIIVTTDLLSRGIDITQISLVINFDIPSKIETYIHRIGRTGRFGKKGYVINIVTNSSLSELSKIINLYNEKIELKQLNFN